MKYAKVDENTLKQAMHAIYKLQSSIGIDLSDEDGYGEVYYALEEAVKEAE
ncbi:hypothetical protein MKX29_24030 [Cytobacillus sp. FSL R7-0696]|uniref:hypothetical protein n=1 Tax=Cytobacillus sp. FSL R7-0696 TaxID=2921691 RepID=UPI0030FA7C37